MVLTPAQTAALAAVRTQAVSTSWSERLTELVVRGGTAASEVDRLRAALWKRARVAIHFHPDRLLGSGESVAGGLLRTGRYLSQFETRISNGSRTAFPGGRRDLWEEQLFGSAYSSAPLSERPKYGALQIIGHADGPSPRFGSCYLLLRSHVGLERTSFTWGDSHLGPSRIGTADAFDAVFAAWLEQSEQSGEALGFRGDVPAVLEMLLNDRPLPMPERAAFGRTLDDYIEAQVHGDLDLATDVERLVIDPVFDETETGRVLSEIGEQLNVDVRRHPGFLLNVSEVPDDFRGPRMPAFARRVADRFSSRPNQIDAATIGRAAASHHRRPHEWDDWDTPEETLQHLKQLWHVTVRFGHPR